MFRHIKKDIEAILDRDPAATGKIEAFFLYPGLHALWAHRVAHWLYGHHMRLIARFMSEVARFITGIEIHPGAQIGEGFFIDHGMGVVIGETTEIGKNVTLYQGVTLGGTGKEKGKRHPTLEDDVVVGVGACVLGSITVGRSAKIGAGAVVINAVPPDTTVVGVPGHAVVRAGERLQPVDLHHENLPDPVVEMFRCINRRIDRIEHQVSGKNVPTTGGTVDETPTDEGPAAAEAPGGEDSSKRPAQAPSDETVDSCDMIDLEQDATRRKRAT